MSDDVEKEEEKSFKVQDRRRFTDEGEPRSPETSDNPETVTQSGSEGQREASAESAAPEAREAQADQGPQTELPPINFSTFVISLSTQALMQLGEIKDPETGVIERNVEVAKQTIDILAMLDDKCRGNLDEHEAHLIQEVLYDLRMRYVEAVRYK